MRFAAFFDTSSLLGRMGFESCAARGAGRLAAVARDRVPEPRDGRPELLRRLEAVYRFCRAEGIAAAAVFSPRAASFDPARTEAFLSEKAGAPAALMARVPRVGGVAVRHGPRHPCVDADAVFLNVDRAAAAGYFERRPLNACHFERLAGDTAVLTSHIEYACRKGEFEDVLDPDAVLDAAGRPAPATLLPFSMCLKTGVLLCAEGDARLEALAAANLGGGGPRGPSVTIRGGLAVYRDWGAAAGLVRRARRFLHEATDFEFRKRYDDE